MTDVSNDVTVVTDNSADVAVTLVPLTSITATHNPRRPMPNLQDNLVAEGYYTDFYDEDTPEGEEPEVLESVPYTPLELVRELVVNGDDTSRAKFVRLLDKYESHPDGIVPLAISRERISLQSIILRQGEMPGEYAIVAGERRFLAAVYSWVKNNGADVIGAQIRIMSEADAATAALDENSKRLNPSPVEVGHMVATRYASINPDTGKKYTMRATAKSMNLDYQHAHGRYALTVLSEKEQRAVENGEKSLTKAIEKGKAIIASQRKGKKSSAASNEIPDKGVDRIRSLNLASLQSRFDVSVLAEENDDFLRGLSVAMFGNTDLTNADKMLAKAKKESAKRIKEAEKAAAKEAKEAEKAAAE